MTAKNIVRRSAAAIILVTVAAGVATRGIELIAMRLLRNFLAMLRCDMRILPGRFVALGSIPQMGAFLVAGW